MLKKHFLGNLGLQIYIQTGFNFLQRKRAVKREEKETTGAFPGAKGQFCYMKSTLSYEPVWIDFLLITMWIRSNCCQNILTTFWVLQLSVLIKFQFFCFAKEEETSTSWRVGGNWFDMFRVSFLLLLRSHPLSTFRETLYLLSFARKQKDSEQGGKILYSGSILLFSGCAEW